MDIKATVEKAVTKITTDSNLLDKFKKDPKSAVKSVVGSAVSDDVVSSVITAVNAKIGGDKLSGVAKTLGGLFGK